jgi:hypothetical protein
MARIPGATVVVSPDAGTSTDRYDLHFVRIGGCP